MSLFHKDEQEIIPSWKVKMDAEARVEIRITNINTLTKTVTMVISGSEIRARKGEQIYLDIPFKFRRDTNGS